MCPGEKIHYVARTPWSVQWIGLYGKTVEKYMDLLSIDGSCPTLTVTEYYEMERILDDLYKLIGDRNAYAKCHQIALIYQFFLLLLRNSSRKTVVDIAESVKRIIDYNFDKNMTVKDIASMLYISPEHLTRQFAEKYQISPKEYLVEKRIAHAKRLLRETTVSVKEISASVGYADPLYFSRLFKKKEGMSPMAYREGAK